MPPHCDSMDGPVVKAARDALDREDVDLVLPYVYKQGEPELRDAFDLVIKVRKQGPEAHELADRFFFETTVRIHRAGEGAPYTGLKAAGLDVGPVIPLAEKSIEDGSPEQLIQFFIEEVESEIARRFEGMLEVRTRVHQSVDEAREYVSAVLELQVWAHKLYSSLKAVHAHEEDQSLSRPSRLTEHPGGQAVSPWRLSKGPKRDVRPTKSPVNARASLALEKALNN